MGSREDILSRLRSRARPFPAVAPPDYLAVVPLSDTSPDALRALFVNEARWAGCVVHEPLTNEAAIDRVLSLIGQNTAVLAWDADQLPLPGLAAALDRAGVARITNDAEARLGLTGVDAALAATGSLVLLSGRGRPRVASLLPLVHVALLPLDRIVPDLESWLAAQQAAGPDALRRPSNPVIITGPSRTADIAMQLVMGMHGPQELHIILVTDNE